MEDIQIGNLETVVEEVRGLWSVCEDFEGNLFAVTQKGSVHQIFDRQYQQKSSVKGKLSGICFDPSSTFVCDTEQKLVAICKEKGPEASNEFLELIKDWEGSPLKGPNSIAYNEVNNCLYFTDSGFLKEASLDSPKGSLFYADLDRMRLVDLAVDCFRYPCGLAVSPDGTRIYFAETLENRVLRLAQSSNSVPQISVFHQFTGRAGPTAIAISDTGILCVANFDYADYSHDGLITVLDLEGEVKAEIPVPQSPEITGLFFSRTKPNLLYIADSGNEAIYSLSILTNEFI